MDDLNVGAVRAADALRVQGCDSEVHRLSMRGDGLLADAVDPQIVLSRPHPWRALGLDMRMPEGYTGDGLVIYYSLASAPGFTEEQTLRIDLGNKRFLTRVWEFDEPVDAIRVDVTEQAGPTGISALSLTVEDNLDAAFCVLFGEGDEPKRNSGVIVVTHDLSKTGAPLLARRIAEEMISQGHRAIVVCINQGGGDIAPAYWDAFIPLYELEMCFEVTDGDVLPVPWRLLRALRAVGFDAALLNTVISAQYAEIFKRAGMKTVSLIHETRETLEIHGMDALPQKAASFSDRLVFPAQCVLDGFLEMVPATSGEVLVRPQGVYLSEDRFDENALTSLFSELGISEKAKIVLGSGTPDLRKGYDLFVSAAITLKDLMPDEDLRFIWTGYAENHTYGFEYLKRLELQVARSSAADCFCRLGFLDAALYSSLLSRSSVFWCTSRDDTFPSVVLEAMHRGVPAAAFAGTGGVDVMLSDGRGALVEGFSVLGLADVTRSILRREASGCTERARRWVTENLEFPAYVSWLLDLCALGPVVGPSETGFEFKPEVESPCDSNDGFDLKARGSLEGRAERCVGWRARLKGLLN